MTLGKFACSGRLVWNAVLAQQHEAYGQVQIYSPPGLEQPYSEGARATTPVTY